MEQPQVLIVTGLSGAGKSLAVNALEDIGYFCMDNIPAALLGKLMALAIQGGGIRQRMAVVLDSRGGKSAREILDALDELKKMGVFYKILFLDAAAAIRSALPRVFRWTRLSIWSGRFSNLCIHLPITELTPPCFQQHSSKTA